MKRIIKSYPMPLWVLLLLVVAASVGFAGWADEHNERQSDVVAHTKDSDRFERNEDRLARIAVSAMAAQAITMQGRQYEAGKAGGLDADLTQSSRNLQTAYGRIGSLKAQLNQSQAEVCKLEQMLRDNAVRIRWRSECKAGIGQ